MGGAAMEEEAVQTKGSGLHASLNWITKTYGAAAHDRVVASLPPEQRQLLRLVLPSSWYPISLASTLHEAIAEQLGGGDRASIERTFKDMSRFVAEENLSTLYRAMLILMTPERLFETLPRLWNTYFKGIEVQNVRTPNAKRGICTVTGLGHLMPYIGPSACGWLELAFSKVGGHLKVQEQNWNRGRERGNPLVFDFDWS
jgi:hypothetical protein